MKSDSTYFSRSLLSMAALTAMLASLPVQAADQVLASASASLTNLQIQVIDLTPDDGIAASVTFSLGVLVSDHFEAGAEASDISRTTFDLNALSSTGWTGTVSTGTYSFSSSALSLTSEAKASELHAAMSNIYSPGNHVTGFSKSLYFDVVAPEVSLYYTPFFMGANTAVIISGNAVTTSSSAAVPSGELASLFDPAVSDISQLAVETSASGYVQLSLDGQGRPRADTGYPNSVQVLSYSEQGVEGTDGPWVQSSPFFLSLENASSETTTDAFVLSLRVDVSAGVIAPDLSTPAIPEPSTYALMGLGLAGIGLARRRAGGKG
ncbi:MAG: hypothetical protein C0487_15485 [Leptothrix sp. (in: Bacteria)]|nr:hypothetical protein [Leptothrix sp. (in: b-proteobacteria)]